MALPALPGVDAEEGDDECDEEESQDDGDGVAHVSVFRFLQERSALWWSVDEGVGWVD